MAWTIEYAETAIKQLRKLDKLGARRVPLRCVGAAEAWEARAGGGGLGPLNLSTPQAMPVAGAGQLECFAVSHPEANDG